MTTEGTGVSLDYTEEREHLRPVLEVWEKRLREEGVSFPVSDLLTDLAPVVHGLRQPSPDEPVDEHRWMPSTRQERMMQHHFGWATEAQEFVLWEAGRPQPVARINVPDALGLVGTVANVLRNGA